MATRTFLALKGRDSFWLGAASRRGIGEAVEDGTLPRLVGPTDRPRSPYQSTSRAAPSSISLSWVNRGLALARGRHGGFEGVEGCSSTGTAPFDPLKSTVATP